MTPSDTTSPRRPPWWRSASTGIAAAAAALGAAELVAGLRSGWRSPVLDVGDRAIDFVPPPVKDFAIAVFGTGDKVALLVGIGLVLVVYAATVGIATLRLGRLVGVAGILAFGVVGMVASIGGGLSNTVPSAVATAVGVPALLALTRSESPARSPHLEASRRSFLVHTGAVVAGAAFLGVGGRALSGRFDAAPSQAGVALPRPVTSLPVVAAGTSFDVTGLSPLVTPNDNFYRIDTALTVPQVPTETYSLAITGMVSRPSQLSYDDLLRRDLIETDITLTCVSNEVGGRLVGNARWLGIPLAELLEEAGVSPDADQIVGRSVDGYTCGFPVAVALDGRDAIVAVGMNGEPLPLQHGFPVRLVVPGLYGYVSATKWLAEIELTTFDAFDHYWARRDWAVEAPIKTQSRIDTPAALAQLPVGPTAIAGVAWAQTRGIEAVEVQIDGGAWQQADLAEELADTTWRQWKLEWEATPGRHEIAVRATDGEGETQTSQRARPIPDGATGWHSIVVMVDH